jgi:hypothetical protein
LIALWQRRGGVASDHSNEKHAAIISLEKELAGLRALKLIADYHHDLARYLAPLVHLPNALRRRYFFVTINDNPGRVRL